MPDALDRLAAAAGILPSYTDQTGRRRRTGRATMRSLLAGMKLSAGTEAEAAETLAELDAQSERRRLPGWVVTEPGRAPPLTLHDLDWRLTREDGSTDEGRGPLPALPLGLHRVEAGGSRCTVIAAPPRLPRPGRIWGVMLPFYALRPAEAGGLADCRDLAEAGRALAAHGADFVGLNPIHAGFPCDASGFSPYTPSHRRRLNILHIATGETDSPGAPLIDYAADIPARRDALGRAHAAFLAAGGDPDFDAWRAAEGDALERFALHQALSDRYGPYWRDWPAAYRDPASAETRAAGAGMPEALTFHAWAQWQATRDLRGAQDAMRSAGMGVGLYLDLAVGTHPAGAETWEDRDSFAYGASLGAPPDAFAADGQSWGLAPFDPRALVAKGFEPLAETLRCQLALAGALRIDHIIGFDRAFWVPETGGPGAYVQMPRAAMLAVLRLEAARAGAIIVGEDLGNIPRGLRGALDRSGVLGCRVQLFERTAQTVFRAPEAYDRTAIASFSTHDLPTWRGWRAGAEIAAHRELGHLSDGFAADQMAQRKAEVSAFDTMTAGYRGAGTRADDPDAMHAALAATASDLAQVQVENLLDIDAQPNLPGTVTEYPNWRQRLPIPPADLRDDARLARTARLMARHGRGKDPT